MRCKSCTLGCGPRGSGSVTHHPSQGNINMLEYNKKIKVNYCKSIGYCYFYDPEHPLNTKTGWIYYHRHVASLKIGRWLTSKEVVHHIDGNIFNNDPSNLQVVTQSEHNLIHKPAPPRKSMTCSVCGRDLVSKDYYATFCSALCSQKAQRRFEISKEELEKLVWEKPSIEVAKMFGVTDKAIEKRCKKYGITKPPRGYWRKIECGQIPIP